MEVAQPFLSADAIPMTLGVGLRGSILRVDSEGDADVYFPAVALNGVYRRVCVFEYDFIKLRSAGSLILVNTSLTRTPDRPSATTT